MKGSDINNDPELVKRLAKHAMRMQGFNKPRELKMLIKEHCKTRKIIEDIWRLRAERRGRLSMVILDDRGEVLTIDNSQSIANALNYIECFLESRAAFLDRWINSFDV